MVTLVLRMYQEHPPELLHDSLEFMVDGYRFLADDDDAYCPHLGNALDALGVSYFIRGERQKGEDTIMLANTIWLACKVVQAAQATPANPPCKPVYCGETMTDSNQSAAM